jgi:hypothetical protein
MKIAVLWYVTPYKLVEPYKRVGGTRCLCHQGGRFLILLDRWSAALRTGTPGGKRKHLKGYAKTYYIN